MPCTNNYCTALSAGKNRGHPKRCNVIARSLNRLTDSAFVGALSENDSAAMANLIADYFCGDSDSGMSC